MAEGVDSHRQLDNAGRSTTGILGGFRGILGGVTGAVGALLPSLSAVGGLSWAMQRIEENTRAANEQLQRNIELASEATKATLDPQALSLKFNPEDEAYLVEQSRFGGRSRTELAPLFTSFKSATSTNLNEQQQREFFTELVIVPGLATGGPLDSFADLASRASAVVDDPVQLRNLQALYIKAAGEGDPAAAAKAGADLLPAGQAAGLEPQDTPALQAFASTVYGADQAKTKLEQLLLRLQTDPQVAELLADQGVTPEQDFFAKLDTLRKAKTPTGELVKIANTEHVGLLQALLSRPEQVEASGGTNAPLPPPPPRPGATKTLQFSYSVVAATLILCASRRCHFVARDAILVGALRRSTGGQGWPHCNADRGCQIHNLSWKVCVNHPSWDAPPSHCCRLPVRLALGYVPSQSTAKRVNHLFKGHCAHDYQAKQFAR